jgi:16S rRNA (guanine527-N7)-methyltransferase
MFHVKRSGDDDPAVAQLQRLAEASGLDLTASAARVCVQYLAGLLEANRSLNLTRISGWRDGVRLHLLDSLIALPELQAAQPGEALDLGSGGGLPGVPLAIASGRDFVLLDSVAKKSAAVASILERLGLSGSVSVCSARAEELAQSNPGGFSAVVARAVAPLPSLVELSAPLLQEGGRLIALKGRPESVERESGAAVGRIVGMVPVSERLLELPDGGETRTILVYERRGVSHVPLPRRPGMAQKRPLG